MPHQNLDEREARKRYVHKRQVKVFTIVIAAMAVVLVVAILGFFQVFNAQAKETPSQMAADNFGEPTVCAPADANKNPAVYLQNSQVTVRVLNGTQSSGFAGAVAEALQNRQFALTTVSNYTTQKMERTTIYYGVNAISDAYTLNANFTDAKMVMDDRQDKLVDVVIGATFNDLAAKRNVPAPGAKITNFKGCTVLDQVDRSKLPHAISHDPVLAPVYDQNSTSSADGGSVG